MDKKDFVWVDPATLQPWEKNPREIDEDKMEALKKYIKKYHLLTPLLVDGRDKKTVLGGNMRLRAVKELGLKKIPVKYVDVKDDEQAIEVALLDNASFGRYVKSKLEALMAGVKIDMRDIDIALEFDFAENFKPPEKVSNVDEVPEIEYEINIPDGTLFELGDSVRIIQGDSTKPEIYKKLFEGVKEQARMVLTDPPYNIDYKGGMGAQREGILNDKMTEDQFYRFLYDFIYASKKYVKGAWYIFMSSKELGTLKKAFENNGLHWHEFVVWVKNRFTLAMSDYKPKMEPFMVGESENATEIDSEAGIGNFIFYGWNKHYWFGNKSTPNVLFYDRPNKSELHPTQKPVGLLKQLILNSSVRNDIVLDMFAGSGSTMVACLETGRKSFNIELDPQYTATVIERYILVTGKTKIKVNGKEMEWEQYKEDKITKKKKQ